VPASAAAADAPDDAPAADDDGEAPPKPLPYKTSDAKPVAGDAAPMAAAFLRSVGEGGRVPPSDEDSKLGSVQTSLDKLAEDQVDYVEDMADKVAGRTDKIAAILKSLGQPVPKSVTGESGTGGPFIPLDPDADPETFRSTVSLVTSEMDRLSTVRRIAGQLPLTEPIENAPITSRFGARIDPFFGRPAVHPGIDFAANVGHPIRATAAGTVITAELAGGYGNMVEIDHGQGVTTRYGHMSKILVKAGQIVPKGAIIGLAGSTGRSTGPHVHYEVRIDGNAIDPMRYIKAGRQLMPLL
jgi:murein DD-endopeptidase MepM/ murein hydrolase activator NlpD